MSNKNRSYSGSRNKTGSNAPGTKPKRYRRRRRRRPRNPDTNTNTDKERKTYNFNEYPPLSQDINKSRTGYYHKQKYRHPGSSGNLWSREMRETRNLATQHRPQHRSRELPTTNKFKNTPPQIVTIFEKARNGFEEMKQWPRFAENPVL